MEFVWLPTFERTAIGLLDESDQRTLELVLIERPDRGDLMPRTGGFRKLRFRRPGHGKRGGIRVIYFYVGHRRTIYVVLVYAKAHEQDLSEEQRRELKALARIIKRDDAP